MGLAVFSFDLAPGAPSAPALEAAVGEQLAGLTTWKLLGSLWMLDFPAIADFEAFGDALEDLHRGHAAEFDYFALHFDPGGGPVLIAPNPNVRQPQPVARPRGARALAASVRHAVIAVDDAAAVLTRLEELHARFERKAGRRGAAHGGSAAGRQDGPGRRRPRARPRGLRAGARGAGRRAGAGARRRKQPR